jgi:hypothetical protein
MHFWHGYHDPFGYLDRTTEWHAVLIHIPSEDGARAHVVALDKPDGKTVYSGARLIALAARETDSIEWGE